MQLPNVNSIQVSTQLALSGTMSVREWFKTERQPRKLWVSPTPSGRQMMWNKAA